MKTLVFNQYGLACDAADFRALNDPHQAGVFETMRTYQGIVFELQAHLIRLKESARTAGIRFCWNFGQLERLLYRSLKSYYHFSDDDTDVFVRIMIVAGRLFFMIGQRKSSAQLRTSGVELVTTPVQRPFTNAGAPQIKGDAYQTGVMALLEPAATACEKLFLDAQGYVAEVSVGNIFMVKQGVLKTPSHQGILNGVTRRFVIECALQLGIKTEETRLTRHEFFNADEVFLTNTSWEILPVREIDRRAIGRKIPGSVTRSIHKQFKRKVMEKCRK